MALNNNGWPYKWRMSLNKDGWLYKWLCRYYEQDSCSRALPVVFLGMILLEAGITMVFFGTHSYYPNINYYFVISGVMLFILGCIAWYLVDTYQV